MPLPSPITRGNRDLSYPHTHLTHDHATNTEVLSQVSKGISLEALGSSSMLDPVTNTAHLIFKQFFHLKNYILIVVIVVTVEEFHWILLAVK